MDFARNWLGGANKDKGKKKEKKGKEKGTTSRLIRDDGEPRVVTASGRIRAASQREDTISEVPTRPKIRIRRSDLPAGSIPPIEPPVDNTGFEEFQTFSRPTIGGKGPLTKMGHIGGRQVEEEDTEEDDSEDADVEEEEMAEEEMEEEMAEEPPVRHTLRQSNPIRRVVFSSSSGTTATSKRKATIDSWRLTTSVEGGPLKPDLLIGFMGHVAYKVWQGEERGPLSSPNKKKLLQNWDLYKIRADARQLVNATGLGALFDTTPDHLDMNLISAFVERWHPETNSFHMPFGEMTVTLHDVAFLLKIPVDGEAVFVPNDVLRDILPTAARFVDMTQAQLKASSVEWRSGALKLQTIKKCMLKANVDANKYATGYLMFLLGATLFADKADNYVSSHFLPLLLRLDEVSHISWGSGALAYLYRQLGMSSRSGCVTMCGYLALLQAWIYAYFPQFAPPTREEWTDELPYACKWITFDTSRNEAALLQYRRQLDGCRESDVRWTPFRRAPAEGVRISLFSGIIHCRDIKEPYMPERVLRQFGYAQNVPPIPIAPNECYLGPNPKQYVRKYFVDPTQFSRASVNLFNPASATSLSRSGFTKVDEYMPWFLDRTHPRVHNGEGAVAQQHDDFEQVRVNTLANLTRMHPMLHQGPYSFQDLESTVVDLCLMWEYMMPEVQEMRNEEGLNL